MVDTVGHGTGPQQIQPNDNNVGGQGPQSGLRAIGQKIVKFFSDLGASIKNAFQSIGKQAAQQPAHGTGTGTVDGTVTAHVPKNDLSSSDKKAMLKAFKESEFRDSLIGGNLHVNEGRATTAKDVDRIASEILDRPTATKAMARHGVSLEEAVAIYMYTTDAYKDINPALWGGKAMTDDIQGCVDLIRSGLDKLPSAHGQDGRVKHGCHTMPDDVMLKYQVGSRISEDACYSTSDSIPLDFKGHVEFIIVTKDGSAGKAVDMFSRSPGEAEILFPPGSSFDVTGRQVATMNMGMLSPFKDSSATLGGSDYCRIVMVEV